MRNTAYPFVIRKYRILKISSLTSNLKKFHSNWRMVEQIRGLYLKREWLDCIALCNDLHELVKQDFFSLYFRALCKYELNLFDDALDDFEMSRVILDQNKFPWIVQESYLDIDIGITQIYRKKRNYETALEHLDNAILANPKYSKSILLKANIYEDMDKSGKAMDTINDGLKFTPKTKNY